LRRGRRSNGGLQRSEEKNWETKAAVFISLKCSSSLAQKCGVSSRNLFTSGLEMVPFVPDHKAPRGHDDIKSDKGRQYTFNEA
jgi:hypothetical protein